MDGAAPTERRKRRAGGVSERTLRRRRAEGTVLPRPTDPSDTSNSDDNISCDDTLDGIHTLFQEDKEEHIPCNSFSQLPSNSFSQLPSNSFRQCSNSSNGLEPVQTDCEQNSDCAAAIVANSHLTADEFDSLFCGNLRYDCDECMNCSCIACDECKHSECGDCVHCDWCKFRCFANDDDGFFDDDDEEILSPEDARNKAIKEGFKNIVHDHLIPQTVVNDMLAFFRKWSFGDFPKSAKTLLETPQVTPTRPVPPGEYWHAGITTDVVDFVNKTGCEAVKVTVSCDGVPLAGSSNSSFWPILCSFNNSSDVVLAGAYHGYHKPDDSNVYLEEFNVEIKRLCTEGVIVDGRSIPISFHCLCCDAPAKAFVLKIKNFNGYFSCPKCTTEGEMDGRRMCFPEVDAPLRTNESFKSHQQSEHHVGKTDIQDIPTFGPVSSVPYDYMHLVVLGVMKKVMYMWLQGPLKVRLKGHLARIMSDLLVSLMLWKPRELVRKLRQLQYIKRFKATEFRQILLYAGPVVFEEVLPKDLYEHFMVLHVAMTLLVHPSFAETHVDYAEELLKFWVMSFKSLYGAAYVSHNIHGMLHLAEDVRKFGPVDNFSAFKFENYLQFVIKLVRKGDKPLQQLARRYTELRTFTKGEKKVPDAGTLSVRHVDGPLIAGCANPQFKKLQLPGSIQLDCSSEADNCCVLDDGSVLVVKNFAFCNSSKEMVVLAMKFLTVTDLYRYPISSSVLGAHYVKDLSPLQSWPLKCVSNKLYRMPLRSGFAVVPLLHAEKAHV